MYITSLQSLTGLVQGQNRDFPVSYFHSGKNLLLVAGIPVVKTGFSLLEILHRETLFSLQGWVYSPLNSNLINFNNLEFGCVSSCDVGLASIRKVLQNCLVFKSIYLVDFPITESLETEMGLYIIFSYCHLV